MSSDYRIEQKDIDLLRTAGMNETDLDHSLKVAAKALEIARRTGVELDMELVGRGALFHDLGKTVTHEITHGQVGAELGLKLGLLQAVNTIMEKHIRGGLTGPEALELGLPVKDYTLHRLEERVIIYADRLVDIINDGIVAIKEEAEAEARFSEILTSIPKYGKNEITLKRYLGYHEEIQSLIAGQIIDVSRLKELLDLNGVTLLDVRRKTDHDTTYRQLRHGAKSKETKPLPTAKDVQTQPSARQNDAAYVGSKTGDASCDGCHTTGYSVAKDKESGRWQGQKIELGIACEACHGPGSAHA